MPQYITCEYCGSNLDYGETCDCKKKEGAPSEAVHPQEFDTKHILSQETKNVTSLGGKEHES